MKDLGSRCGDRVADTEVLHRRDLAVDLLEQREEAAEGAADFVAAMVHGAVRRDEHHVRPSREETQQRVRALLRVSIEKGLVERAIGGERVAVQLAAPGGRAEENEQQGNECDESHCATTRNRASTSRAPSGTTPSSADARRRSGGDRAATACRGACRCRRRGGGGS